MYRTDFKKIKFCKQYRQWMIWWTQFQNNSFVTMETLTSWITSSEKCLFGFYHLNSVVETKFFSKGPTYLNVNYLLQQHGKLLEGSSHFNNFIQCLIYISKLTKFLSHWHKIAYSWTRINYCVHIFDICSQQISSYYHSKGQLCGMFQFWSAKVCICTSISWYFNEIEKIAFPEQRKNFSNDSALFP